MARRKANIEHFFSRDEKALKMIAKTGHCTTEQFKRNGIAENRIKSYLSAKMIEKKTFIDKDKEPQTAYRLTLKAKEIIKNKYDINSFYRSNSIKHDVKLAEKYLSLTEDQRESWKTEIDLREEYNKKIAELKLENNFEYIKMQDALDNKAVSMPDCSYIESVEQTVCIEITTNNYSKQEIAAKQLFAEKMHYKIEFERS